MLTAEEIERVAQNMERGTLHQQNHSNTYINHTDAHDLSFFPQLATPENAVTNLNSGLPPSTSLSLNSIARKDHYFFLNPLELSTQSMPVGASTTNYSAYYTGRHPVDQNSLPHHTHYDQTQQQPPDESLSRSSNLNEGQLQFLMDPNNFGVSFSLDY